MQHPIATRSVNFHTNFNVMRGLCVGIAFILDWQIREIDRVPLDNPPVGQYEFSGPCMPSGYSRLAVPRIS